MCITTNIKKYDFSRKKMSDGKSVVLHRVNYDKKDLYINFKYSPWNNRTVLFNNKLILLIFNDNSIDVDIRDLSDRSVYRFVAHGIEDMFNRVVRITNILFYHNSNNINRWSMHEKYGILIKEFNYRHIRSLPLYDILVDSIPEFTGENLYKRLLRAVYTNKESRLIFPKKWKGELLEDPYLYRIDIIERLEGC